VNFNRLIRGVAAASVLALGASVIAAGGASAATVNGTLTLQNGSTVLTSGAATDPFQAVTPGAAACSNTGPNGYEQLGYMIPKGDPITGAVYSNTATNFSSGGSTYGFLLQTAALVNYGPEGPGSNGLLNGSPTLQFSPSNAPTDLGLSSTNPTAVWEVGVACIATNPAFNPGGSNSPVNQVVDNWNCEVTFNYLASSNSYNWTDQCGSAPTPEVPMAAALPLAGLGAAVVVFGGATYVRRRRTTQVGAA